MHNPAFFGPRLKELREAAGLTQSQLAERAGLHRQGIVKLERGEREPAWGTVLALMDALGVSCQAFLEEPGPQPEAKPGRPRKVGGATDDQPADRVGMPPPQRKPARRKPPKPRGG
jgi:transcriptional regulator with XRE-family HTH domain